MNYRLQILQFELKEKGLWYVLKRIISFLFRPFSNLIQSSAFLVNLSYGVIPNLWLNLPFVKKTPKKLEISQSELIKKVREFWYFNIPGNFDLNGEKISRRDIFTYGGPNPKFTCSICQKSEWLSRIKQKNLFQPHQCPQAKECEDLCQKQGKELWTHYHQNFDFMVGCDPDLPVPKVLILTTKKSFDNFCIPRCDLGPLVGKRRWAFSCQIDVTFSPFGIDWSKYDLLFMSNEGNNQKFPHPNIPVILSCHDFYLENKGYQWVIDWLQPEILLTSCPTQWRENFKIPPHTKIVFYPLFPSIFFTRPNPNENKKIDLLVIGTTASVIYKPRSELSRQISKLVNKYKIEFSNRLGALGAKWQGPTFYIDSITQEKVYYLNKWSEYLGSAKYVIFGRIGDPKKQFLLFKYYEALGSGAVPIFPEVPDLKLLEVKPFEHYIPLSEVEDNNERLVYFLDHYEDFKYIARNAIDWYKRTSDKMLFEDFENLIREITNYKYPKRLI